jgi:hypothetical protein
MFTSSYCYIIQLPKLSITGTATFSDQLGSFLELLDALFSKPRSLGWISPRIKDCLDALASKDTHQKQQGQGWMSESFWYWLL